MGKSRIEAFTDAIIAIVMTIMVLEIHAPETSTFKGLWGIRDSLSIYAFSFFVLSVYWINHHHLFSIVHKVSGRVIWLNMILMFFLSFFPFTSAWVLEGGHFAAKAPELTYGTVILLANIIWALMVQDLIRVNGKQSLIGKSLGADYNKPFISIGMAALAVVIGIYVPLAVFAIDGLMFLLWIVPEKRIERTLQNNKKEDD
ncbi:TMEM175 family protein [Agrilactobacillus fermenti]|uniref:TMEM175 family protein n=1 Tax=Agrilactobacillus fermenti TaxID=2586909 RepID=UPI001E648F8F|nr:TMEM175 family protein [Agrilactobacillus fermenti]MCD2255993.1 DUF1211 domain-containing protein [Agrilactobacillus fermenti]